MAKLRCKTCGEEWESGQMMSCKSCNAVLCPACSAGAHDMCSYCYDDLRHFH